MGDEGCMRILMIEDDKEMSDAVIWQLVANGYEVDACYTGTDAAYYLENGVYDMILLDRMLPGKDGIDLLREIRSKNILTPVIMLTALSELADKIEGLDAGADDYLAKPYSVEELMARIRALLRRPRKLEKDNKLVVGNICLDVGQLVLTGKEKSCSLSKKEAGLLEYFLKNRDQVLTRDQILSYVWGADHFVEEGNVDTYVHFARRRLKMVESNLAIKSVHGVGYKLVEEQYA